MGRVMLTVKICEKIGVHVEQRSGITPYLTPQTLKVEILADPRYINRDTPVNFRLVFDARLAYHIGSREGYSQISLMVITN